MTGGLLWFDDNPMRKVEEKVQRAAARYQQKFGSRPNVCYVHPSLLDGNRRTLRVGEVEVRPSRTVLPYHFLVTEVRD